MSEALNSEEPGDELRDEYEFTPEQLRGAVRGKYAERFARSTNLVLLDPDVAEVFPDAEAVNQALRALASVIRARTQHNEAA
ncbi:MAG: hypothetical protein H0X52_06815 [Gemmatimonadetes bacterium]|jgi:hypothetical protein|nr:hypothetical protein [Gemmatimonadota bacterium]